MSTSEQLSLYFLADSVFLVIIESDRSVARLFVLTAHFVCCSDPSRLLQITNDEL